MRKLSRPYEMLLLGILLALSYGLLIRFIFGRTDKIATLSFFFLIPCILGMIPVFFASKELLERKAIIFISPVITNIFFFILMILLGFENLFCLIVLLLPFILLSVAGAWLCSVLYRRKLLKREKKTQNLAMIAVLPFLLLPLEEFVDSPIQASQVKNAVIINATPEIIWKNIVRVNTISSGEYNAGIFNRLGIPRPLKAAVDFEGVGGARTGEFDGGLIFHETITEYDKNKFIAFSIKVDPTTIGKDVFHQHVLSGNYFSFIGASYALEPLADGKTRLILSSGYQLRSKFNFYGEWWGNIILSDFQNRLLQVIKNRCER